MSIQAITREGLRVEYADPLVNVGTEEFPLWVRPSMVAAIQRSGAGSSLILSGGGSVSSPLPMAVVVEMCQPPEFP